MEEDDKGCQMIRLGVSGCFFWYRPTRVVPDQRPLNGCVCVCVALFSGVTVCWARFRQRRRFKEDGCLSRCPTITLLSRWRIPCPPTYRLAEGIDLILVYSQSDSVNIRIHSAWRKSTDCACSVTSSLTLQQSIMAHATEELQQHSVWKQL